MSAEVPKPGRADGADLFDQQPGGLAVDLDLGARKDAGRALVEVGAIITTERGNSSFAWSTTPKRSPCGS